MRLSAPSNPKFNANGKGSGVGECNESARLSQAVWVGEQER